jgi:hypothetical protein
MALTLIQFLTAHVGPGGLYNPGDLAGVDSAVATTLMANGVAQTYNAGDGAGVATASPFRGIGEAETPSEYEAAGGTLGDQTVSAAIHGYIGETTIVDGRAVPDSEASWA